MGQEPASRRRGPAGPALGPEHRQRSLGSRVAARGEDQAVVRLLVLVRALNHPRQDQLAQIRMLDGIAPLSPHEHVSRRIRHTGVIGRVRSGHVLRARLSIISPGPRAPRPRVRDPAGRLRAAAIPATPIRFPRTRRRLPHARRPPEAGWPLRCRRGASRARPTPEPAHRLARSPMLGHRLRDAFEHVPAPWRSTGEAGAHELPHVPDRNAVAGSAPHQAICGSAAVHTRVIATTAGWLRVRTLAARTATVHRARGRTSRMGETTLAKLCSVVSRRMLTGPRERTSSAVAGLPGGTHGNPTRQARPRNRWMCRAKGA